MIKNLTISNFKSIKELQMKPQRINLLIGEPNAGKSNLLEVLGLFSAWGHDPRKLRDFVRFQNISNLFYDDLTENTIVLRTNHFIFTLRYEYDAFILQESSSKSEARFNHDGEYSGGSSSGNFTTGILPELKAIKFYRFKNLTRFQSKMREFLVPPDGSNLFSVIYGNNAHRVLMQQLVKDFGFRLVFKPQDLNFEIQKQVKDTIISYPYVVTSDTLRHMVFYMFAINSNKDSILVFEEPEGHVFPYYTKLLAEKIALDTRNQYFIATHNPYFLTSILAKAPKATTKIFVTYFEDYQTKLTALSSSEIEDILDSEKDPFFNISSFYKM